MGYNKFFYSNLISLFNLLETANVEKRLRLKNLFEQHLKVGYNKEFENEIEKKLK